MKKELFHDVLQIGADNFVDGISFFDLAISLQEKGHFDREFKELYSSFVDQPGMDTQTSKGLSEKLQKRYDKELNKASHYYKISHSIAVIISPYAKDKVQKTYTMRPDYYFNHLEYVELQEARNSSKSAVSYSRWAIAVSLAAIGFSLVLATCPISIEKNQYNNLKPIQFDLSEINSRLDRIEAKIPPQIEQKPEISPVPERK